MHYLCGTLTKNQYPMSLTNYVYELPMKVRDYECDIQGVVNNANYQHYLEHARHEFLLSVGISFADYHDRGIDFIVYRIEIDYKTPLRSRDEFLVRINLKKDGIRWIFEQKIVNRLSGKTCVMAKVVCVALVNGRPKDCPELMAQLHERMPDVF